MSGYGGQPPGWQDPYDPYQGQPLPQPQPGYGQGGWQDPYGSQNYGYGYGPPGLPAGPPASQGAAIGALIANIVCVFFCGILSIAGVVVSALALGRINSDPESARKLTLWGWILFGAGIVLGIVILILYFAVFAATMSADSGTG